MICIIKKCELEVKAKSMCHRHLRVFYSGKDLGLHINTDEQKIWSSDGVGYIQLYDKYGNEKEVAKVDESELDRVTKYKWFSSRKYVVTRIGDSNKFYRLHRYILGFENTSTPFVDHINGDPLDNRKSNLRTVNYSQNSMNKGSKKGSQYKGISFADNAKGELRNKWRVRITIPQTKKYVEVGRFETPEEAAWMYDQFAIALHGDYARTNFDYS